MMWFSRAAVSFYSAFLLLSSSTAVAVGSTFLSEHSTFLTPDDFASVTSHGVWMVEHFSPFCGHCKSFAPMWDELATKYNNIPDSGISFGQVDCSVHGDFCGEHGVKGYPQMNIYRDGKFMEEYKGIRTMELLSEFLDKHRDHQALHPSEINPSGTVLVLNSDNFDSIIGQGSAFVKFFAPWCGHCKKLAPTWTQLARHMQNKLVIAEVNCEDYSSLCKSQDIQGYPSLQYYAHGGKTEYLGGRKFDQLKAFTEKASAPPVQSLLDDELSTHVADNDVLYLFLHSSSSAPMTILSQAAQALLGHPPVFTSTSPDLFRQYEIPSGAWGLVALKDHDSEYPTAKLLGGETRISKDELQTWLFANRLPTSIELTQDTFQSIMNAPQKPIVVIAAVTKGNHDRVAEKFRDIGKLWKLRKNKAAEGRDVVFTWMDADKWGAWMKSMYGLTLDASGDPKVVIADHGNLKYYDVDGTGQSIKLTSTSIFSAVDGIHKGTIAGKNSENVLERVARYLNAKMTAVEKFVVASPMRAVVILGGILVLVFFGMKRILADDYHHADYRDVRKTSRLD